MRKDLKALAIAALSIVAVALAAATLDSVRIPEDEGSNGGNGGGAGEGEGFVPSAGDGPTPVRPIDIPFFEEIMLIVLIGITLAVLVYLVLFWRAGFGLIIAGIVALALLALIAQLIGMVIGVPERELIPAGPGGGGGGDEDGTMSPPSLPVGFLLAGIIVIGLLIAILGRSERNTSDEPLEALEENSTAEIGRIAGETADRIEEDAEMENEIYRAWVEMTELLEVSRPESSTPGELADAAIAAGLGADDVTSLTRLFEDVRYGEREPTEEDEAEAVAILRRIESRYAEDEEP